MWRSFAELLGVTGGSPMALPPVYGSGVARWEVRRGWQDRRSAGRGEDGEVICGRWGTPSMSG
jgi:hypothetical protein